MTNTHMPAVAFPPGEYLRDELDERGWTGREFAEIIGRPAQVVSEILNGKKEITPQTALAFAEALGTSPEVWLSLQTMYQLFRHRESTPAGDLAAVERRARLRELVPVAEVRSRGWITDTSDLDSIERDVCELLEMDSIEGIPHFAMAARRSDSADPATPRQTAWLGRVRRLAETQEAAVFSPDSLATLAAEVPRRLREGPDALLELPSAFRERGVRLVFCEGLRGGKLDGAVTFLAPGQPVIGLTARGDRFDGLVYTLLHECAHLTLSHLEAGDLAIMDEELTEGHDDPQEQDADRQASHWMFPHELDISTTTVQAISATATRFGVHPNLVIGRLQKETGDWGMHRGKIQKVRRCLHEAGLMS